jgi:hypothetical protein
VVIRNVYISSLWTHDRPCIFGSLLCRPGATLTSTSALVEISSAAKDPVAAIPSFLLQQFPTNLPIHIHLFPAYLGLDAESRYPHDSVIGCCSTKALLEEEEISYVDRNKNNRANRQRASHAASRSPWQDAGDRGALLQTSAKQAWNSV